MSERDWAALEKGLLRDIFIRLPSDVDADHFRRVCPNWRAAAAAGVPVTRPWFIFDAADGDDGPIHAFVRPVDRHRHTRVRSVRADSAAVPVAQPPASMRGTSRGWLAVEEGERLFLRDPISCTEIPLPAFDAGYKMFDVFLSDDPLAAPDSWTAFAFFRWDDVSAHNTADVLAFCRPGDAAWAPVDPVDDDGLGPALQFPQSRRYRGLEFFGGRPYVLLGKHGWLAVCDVEARRLVLSWVRISAPPNAGWGGGQEFLVECGGDLLVVQVAQNYEHRSPWYYWPGLCSHRFLKRRVQYYARVFRIVFDADGSGMPVGSQAVASTGDYAVFVAPQGHAFALPACGFPAVRPGCVYFFAVNHDTRTVQGMVVIDLQAEPTQRDKIVQRSPHHAGNWRVLSWFCPRPVLDTTMQPPQRGCRCRCSMHGLRNVLPFLSY